MWRRVFLIKDVVPTEWAIKTAFALAHKKAGSPKAWTLFSRNDSSGQALFIYYSPDCAHLATHFGGLPCEKPTAASIKFFCGSAVPLSEFPAESAKPVSGQ